MEGKLTSPFYQSLKFRFGLLFNSLLFICVSFIAYSLYKNAKAELDRSFSLQLKSSANNILQKTDIDPITIPLPKTGEYFRIIYDNDANKTQLFDNLPRDVSDRQKWQLLSVKKNPENGGTISLDFALSAEHYYSAIQQLKSLLYIYLPIAFLVSFAGGYLLSGFFLKPLLRIINNANSVDLEHITLLSKPPSKDEFYQLTDALNRMLMRIDDQAKQQTAFFTMASHELRTPISNMLTELQIFKYNSLDANTKQLLYHQEQEVNRMKDLVNNFLWMSKIESGNLYINKSPIDLPDLVLQLTEGFANPLLLKNQKFKIHLQPVDEQLKIVADRNQLEVIINNLISNAIKYGNDDSVINIHIFQREKIGLEVSNLTNQTIENPENLKGQFHRNSYHKEGFGLGLWISDQLSKKNDIQLKISAKHQIFSAKLEFERIII